MNASSDARRAPSIEAVEAKVRSLLHVPGDAGRAQRVVVNCMDSPLGPLLAAANDEGLCLLEFAELRQLRKLLQSLRALFDAHLVMGKHPLLATLKEELREYFAGRHRRFDVPLVMTGTDFQRRVWRALKRIPYGRTCNYADIAERIGRVSAVRAVGQANGRNRIVILVPCHRVVSKIGGLGGYSSGVWRKEFLLRLEQRACGR